MARLEGARRIQLVGKWIILIGCTLAALFWVVALKNTSAPSAFGYFVVMFLPPLFLGGIVWVVGWIIEGFQSPTSRN